MKRWKIYIPTLTAEAILVLACVVMSELKGSRAQAMVFSRIAREISFSVAPGPSSSIRFPTEGPYDIRLGYTRIPTVEKNLVQHGYKVDSQARMSARQKQLVDLGLFPTYREKTNSGIRILDRLDSVVYQATRPERAYPGFEAIPSLIVDTLLFIENREILDLDYPYKNPAVEWDRLGKAVLEKTVQEFYPEHSAPGGSTLATQLEKYRHADEGRTRTAKDKLQQMLTASFRAYLDGPVTTERRKKIVLDYINSIPLAALPGYGEVNGLGDGLWAWYGSDFNQVNDTLTHAKELLGPKDIGKLALTYKQVLSLFIAHRRPSGFLLTDVQVLNALTDEHLNLLASHHVIPPELRDAAEEVDLHLRSSAPPPPAISYLDRKAANAIRTQLLEFLSIPKLYDLDQVDVAAHTSIDRKTQDSVTETLRSLKDRSMAEKLGLAGERNLDRGDPAKVVYSVTLYEHVNGQNLLRVETDNYDKPFSINEGTKLDLGSTAKLRVTTNYLGIIDKFHDEFGDAPKPKIAAELKRATDPISQWALDYLLNAQDKSLKTMLDAAMNRTYSANTSETFFTGGGIHHFKNFKKEDDGRTVTITEAIRNSINLPFIRLMRDIVRYYMAQIPGSPTRFTDKENDEARKIYLAKFADHEGSYFMEQFYQKYRNLAQEELMPIFLRDIRPTPSRLSVVFRYLEPEKSVEELHKFLDTWLPLSSISAKTVQSYYDEYAPGKFKLDEVGYLAHVHPLEIWLVRYLYQNPGKGLAEALAASSAERQEVYQWLFKSKSRHAQDIRIRTLVEMEAFLEIHRAWKKVGYPFDQLVPSYATAIGSSGDRPAALAELVGIIMNDGVKYPQVRITELNFAKGTPYETNFKRNPSEGERVLKPEVAARLREALTEVVQNGTARRVDKAFLDADGNPITIGGKTGTGDHRYDTFGRGGQLLSSRVVNRTATFAFFIGRRFFGVVTAHVHGEEAAKYDFTSSLSAGLLKALSPALSPLIIAGTKAEAEESNLTPLFSSTYPGCGKYDSLPKFMNGVLKKQLGGICELSAKKPDHV